MRTLFFLALVISSWAANATELTLSQPVLYDEGESLYAVVHVKWRNAWNNEKNHDAAWLFFKALPAQGGYRTVRLTDTGHDVIWTRRYSPTWEIPQDQTGMFLIPPPGRWDTFEVTLRVELDRESIKGLRLRGTRLMAYGLEMVKIPEGGFTLGDPSPEARAHGGLFVANRQGDYDGLYTVTRENIAIEVGKGEDLYYQAPDGYEGDQQGTIPAEFPKGYDPFFMMKYEPTEGQYVSFLNSLIPEQATEREIFQVDNYSGYIRKEGERYTSDSPNAPCAYLGWDDAMAFADWAALRPMTELEYTKAARGDTQILAGGFPWSTSSKLEVLRWPAEDTGVLYQLNGYTEAQLTDFTMAMFGASYYWVMDLAGSMWEKVISVGHPYGRAFTGQHGDGNLAADGFANVEGWPVHREKTGGFGFRGGGFYGYTREYHQYNPFSPVAYRPYGGWDGGDRSLSYGARFVRDAN